MSNLQIFKNNEFGQIRTIMIENEPWFVAKDVSDILGYSETNRMTARLDDDETISTKLEGMNMKSTLINESGLYNAVLGSKLPSAKKFKKWVTSEVLPSIRKHGAYMTPEKIEEVLLNPDTMIKLLTELKQEREEKKVLQLENQKKDQLLGELKPKADYTDLILKNKGLVTITQIAKDYGMSGEKMNAVLHELRVQYKQSGQWLLYSEHHGKGYTHSETIPIIRSDGRGDIKMNTKWTQKGRIFLYNLLRENGILPIIEQSYQEVACTN